MASRPTNEGTAPRARIMVVATAGLLATTLAACVSSPTPDQMSRTTLATAPADLQLLCANAVATEAGIDSARVLPVASRQLDSRNYQVELEAGGRKSSCIIDDDGLVKSVQPV